MNVLENVKRTPEVEAFLNSMNDVLRGHEIQKASLYNFDFDVEAPILPGPIWSQATNAEETVAESSPSDGQCRYKWERVDQSEQA